VLPLQTFALPAMSSLINTAAVGDSPASNCGCRQCLRDRKEGTMLGDWFVPAEMSMMVVCATCGNKRCPHATDHRHACTNSNEPGQVGSVYE
jgi:hypothetical protein